MAVSKISKEHPIDLSTEGVTVPEGITVNRLAITRCGNIVTISFGFRNTTTSDVTISNGGNVLGGLPVSCKRASASVADYPFTTCGTFTVTGTRVFSEFTFAIGSGKYVYGGITAIVE